MSFTSYQLGTRLSPLQVLMINHHKVPFVFTCSPKYTHIFLHEDQVYVREHITIWAFVLFFYESPIISLPSLRGQSLTRWSYTVVCLGTCCFNFTGSQLNIEWTGQKNIFVPDLKFKFALFLKCFSYSLFPFQSFSEQQSGWTSTSRMQMGEGSQMFHFTSSCSSCLRYHYTSFFITPFSFHLSIQPISFFMGLKTLTTLTTQLNPEFFSCFLRFWGSCYSAIEPLIKIHRSNTSKFAL